MRDIAIVDDFLTAREHGALWDAFQQAAADGLQDWNQVHEAADNATGPPELHPLTGKLFALMSDPPLAIGPWTCFSQSVWTYPAGMGLAWHSDQGYLGGYIYYMHPVWESGWGGELAVAARDGEAVIDPRPNRLVLLRGGVRHCIRKVEAAAGTAVRTSVSGFFFGAGTAGTRICNV